MSDKWKTSISSSGEDSVVRGVPREEIMDMDFADAIWLILKGEKPSEQESKIFNTILSSSIDHGVGTPSTVSARTVQSGGNDMNTSVAGGILALGDKHGGAIEDCMEVLQDEDYSPEEIVDVFIESGDKIPGLGHKVYEDVDPRAEKIFEKAEKLGISGKYVERMKSISQEFAEEKVPLVINVDGAISAVMSDLGWPSELGKGFFIIARTPGLVAHVHEEMENEDFRREDGEYTGE
ncbi:citryl-CoA lyase [Candidatus Nanohalobium constans]|uniref:Citryl-CoA lyase n=1 Tax=Candidatus Nanohalobium constans TaxID=2565781 RepID=A0A5Q0UJA4_9ARCH|nr:citryl-CoA lyase [Candidatus Nanohalobium constans]QGA80909.1 citryl-CoA lyase [Candidatus Nanohalobium constans]